MKPSLIPIFLLLLTSLPTTAQSIPEPPDTIKTIKNPESVIVSRTGDTTMIEVNTSTDCGSDTFTYEVTVAEPSETDSEPVIDFEVPFGIGKKKNEHRTHKKLQTSFFLMGNLYFGQRFNYSDKGSVKNSLEGGIRNVVGIRWSHGAYTPSFSIGLGFGNKRFTAQKGYIYSKEGSNLIIVPVEDGAKVGWTDLNVWNFQIPLLFTIPIGREVEFVAGAVGCFNTYARARTELDFGVYKTTTLYKGLQQRLFTAELTASIGICDILGVYASWSPMTLFQAPYGPQLKSWSIGATINF